MHIYRSNSIAALFHTYSETEARKHIGYTDGDGGGGSGYK